MTHAEILAELERIVSLIAAGQDTETIGRALDALVAEMKRRDCAMCGMHRRARELGVVGKTSPCPTCGAP